MSTDGARRLVLVAGVGRSGTSLFTTILGMVGFHVPQPEVAADSTNPKGFGEPQWVVDFHGRLLRARRVSPWDSRPAAWEETSRAAEDDKAFAELRAWLAVQFVGRDQVVIKDPRIGWFLPLWRRAADDLGIHVSFATLLRHPAEAVSSAITWYGTWQSSASRTLSWDNIMLETEYATRGDRRVFVRYEELLGNWSGEVARAGVALDIPVLRELPEAARAEIDAFVDPSLHRSKVAWSDLGVPAQVEELTEDIWKDFVRLAEPGGDDGDLAPTLDAARERYHRFYAEAEQIAQSSLHALRPRNPKQGSSGAPTKGTPGGGQGRGSRPSGADAVIRLAERVVPVKVRRKVPPVWRARIVRVSNRVGRVVRR